jgi:hypothetical protein
MKNGFHKLESTNHRRGDNLAAHMWSHFGPLSFWKKEGRWLQIITLVLRIVAHSMGMYNRIWTLKYCLELGSKMVHSSESLLRLFRREIAEFFCGVFLCEMSEGQAGWESLIEWIPHSCFLLI